MEAREVAALVTGGASGLGGAVVEKLVTRGAKVAITDIDAKSFPFPRRLGRPHEYAV